MQRPISPYSIIWLHCYHCVRLHRPIAFPSADYRINKWCRTPMTQKDSQEKQKVLINKGNKTMPAGLNESLSIPWCWTNSHCHLYLVTFQVFNILQLFCHTQLLQTCLHFFPPQGDQPDLGPAAPPRLEELAPVPRWVCREEFLKSTGKKLM